MDETLDQLRLYVGPSKVIEFPTDKTAESRERDGELLIVRLIEALLEKAKKGDVSAVAIAHVNKDGEPHTVWEAPWEEPSLVAAITLLQYRYIQAQLELSEETDLLDG